MSEPLTINAEDMQQALSEFSASGRQISLDPETVEQDLARLILGLMEFLRQIMELRAIARMESGRLSDAQEEKLGTTLMRAEQAIHDMAEKFGLKPEDLSLDLGPLGRTI